MKQKKVEDFKNAKVLWQEYKITYSKDLSHLEKKWGECSPIEGIIKLEERLKTSKMLSEVIIHELLHASINLIDSELYGNEKAIEAFSNALLTLMKDNKELFKTIINEI